MKCKTDYFIHQIIVELIDYIGKLHELVRGVQEPLGKTQANVNSVRCLMEKWLRAPLFMRNDSKDSLLSLDDKAEKIDKRYFA